MGAYEFLAVVLFATVMIREGAGLECIECNSFSQPECDSNPAKFNKECPSNATSCRKMEQEIYYDDDYQVRTIRQCAIESGPMKCIERTGTYRFKVYYCHCEGDNCNSAGSFTISWIMASIFATVALLLKL